MKVLILSTRRLQPTYFDTVRADLGGRPDLGLDVVGWVPPAGPVEGLVDSFTLIGPGRMPDPEEPQAVPADGEATDAEDVSAPAGEAGKAPAPEAVTEDTEATTETVAAAQVTEAPAPAPKKPMPRGAKRVVKAVQWRYRRLRRAINQKLPTSVKRFTPMKMIKARRSRNLGKTYWSTILKRRDLQAVIEQADVVIAVDAGAIWAGWKLGQRRAERPVVLGLPAARRELDRLVGAGNG